MKRIFIGMPVYSETAVSRHALQAAIAGHGLDESQYEVAFSTYVSSLLPKGFNYLWAGALSAGYDYFFMLHADVGPAENWALTLLDVLTTHEADVVSCVIPCKNPDGSTSTAIGDPDNNWTPLFRLTLTQLADYPETFTAADVGFRGYPLLINTGCWIADLNKPWCRLRDAHDGSLLAYFEINSRIRYDAGEDHYYVETESEDWAFGRQLHELGCKVMATQAVDCIHYGTGQYPSNAVWGKPLDVLAERPHVQQLLLNPVA